MQPEAPAWARQPVDIVPDNMTWTRVRRVMRLTAALRDDVLLFEQMSMVKRALSDGDLAQAKALYSELEEWEQEAMWVAPSYGGVFTTEERKKLRESIA